MIYNAKRPNTAKMVSNSRTEHSTIVSGLPHKTWSNVVKDSGSSFSASQVLSIQTHKQEHPRAQVERLKSECPPRWFRTTIPQGEFNLCQIKIHNAPVVSQFCHLFCRAIFRWMTTKNMYTIMFDSELPGSPEQVLGGFKDGKTTYARIFECLCR